MAVDPAPHQAFEQYQEQQRCSDAPAEVSGKSTASAAAAHISDFYRWLVGADRGTARAAREASTSNQAEDRTHSSVHAQDQGPDAPQGPSTEQHPSRRRTGLHLDDSNVGYKLLRQAGWDESSGLGAQGQGQLQPIPAWLQSGRSGIGLAPAQPSVQTKQAPADRRLHKQQATKQEDDQQETSKGSQASEAEAPRKPSRAPKRGWEQVRVEEPLEAKVKRVRQVWQAENDSKEGKEVQRLLYRAMRDSAGEPGVHDNSPLLRRHHRLRRQNPLL